jgi:hypothetical protein
MCVVEAMILARRGTEIVQGREDCSGCATNGCLPRKQLACECDLFETSPRKFIQASLVTPPKLTYHRHWRPTSEVKQSYRRSRRKSEDTITSNVVCIEGIHQIKGQTATAHLSLSNLMFNTEELLVRPTNDSQQDEVLVQSEDAVHSRDD